MEIKGISGFIRAYHEQQNISNNRKTEQTKTAQPSDEVVLSSHAQEFSQTIKALKNSPEIREAKVKELADKIADGTYTIASNEIADSIISYSKHN